MPKGWKISIESVNSEKEATPLLGKQVFAQRSDLPPLPKGEFYLSDLLGLPGMDRESGKILGYMDRIEESAPLKSVKTTFWVFKPKKPEEAEWFVPAVAQYIEEVHLDKKVIYLKNLADLVLSEEE